LNGVHDNRAEFNAEQQTFPKLLKQADYETAMIGKWHLKSEPTGFDYWNVLPGQGDYYNPTLIEMGETKQFTGYVTDIITNQAIKWLENRSSEKPFCLMYQHKAPHRNWMPGPEHLEMYDGEIIPEPPTLFDDHESRCAAAYEQEMSIANDLIPGWDLKIKPEKSDDSRWSKKYWNLLNDNQRAKWEAHYEPVNQKFKTDKPTGKALTRWKYQRYIKDYLRCVASVDDNVGRLLDYLDETGLSKNTIVVYTSDQGFYLGDQGWFDKRFMYEESLRMPLLIRYPREIEPGSTSEEMVLNLDFAPTFLDYAGIPIPSDMQGQSLRPILAGKVLSGWRDAMYYHYYEYPGPHMVKRHYGIRTKKYKLIHFYYDIDAWEFYDLEKDPEEIHNIYDHQAYQSIIKELKTRLAVLQKQYGDSKKQAIRFLTRDLEKLKK
jgi:arylsulfatase A-like enzyme